MEYELIDKNAPTVLAARLLHSLAIQSEKRVSVQDQWREQVDTPLVCHYLFRLVG